MAYKFEERLKEVIVSCGENINLDELNENTDLIRDFSFTSINIVQLVVQLENVFDMEIDDDNLSQGKLSSYKSLLEMLKTKLDVEYI